MNNGVANNIKRIIESKGLKQGFVAKKAGLSSKDLSNIINGRKIIRDKTILALSLALNVTPNELFGIVSDEEEEEYNEKISNSQ